MDDIKTVLTSLRKKFQDYNWFYDVGIDRYSRPIVYVHSLTDEVEEAVPQVLGGRQVLVHWAASIFPSSNRFSETNVPDAIPLLNKIQDVTEFLEPEVPDIQHLVDELDRLEVICGQNVLYEIFNEIHNQNAVTKLSSRYPEVREGLSKLYDQYGFDVVYEEL